MNADARREIIQEFVDQNHDVSFAQIRDLFPNVSEMTIRRDLEHQIGRASCRERVFRAV